MYTPSPCAPGYVNKAHFYNLTITCRCCQSTTQNRNILMSCSNPLSLIFPFEGFTSGRFCPAPPKLSYSSLQKSIPQGPLENDNIYIAEYLLRTADSIKPDVFFRRFQGGFSLSYNEPSYSICGCNSTQDVCNFFTPLRASSDGQCPRYSIDQQCALSWAACYAFPQSCRDILEECRGILLSRIKQNETHSICSTVDNSSNSAIVLQSFTTIMEQCITLRNVSNFKTAYNDTNINGSIADELLADILQVTAPTLLIYQLIPIILFLLLSHVESLVMVKMCQLTFCK